MKCLICFVNLSFSQGLLLDLDLLWLLFPFNILWEKSFDLKVSFILSLFSKSDIGETPGLLFLLKERLGEVFTITTEETFESSFILKFFKVV